jgi:hypothetical protein
MTTTFRPPRVIDIEDTVTIHRRTEDLTTHDLQTYLTAPPMRRPDASGEQPIVIPRTIGIVDSPLSTGALPLFVQAALHQPTVRQRRRHVGSHRAVRPSLVARLFGRRGGAL